MHICSISVKFWLCKNSMNALKSVARTQRVNLEGRGPWCSGQSCLLGKSEVAGPPTALDFKFQRHKMFLSHSHVNIQYCGEPPLPRSSVLGIKQPGLEFRILCLEGSVISPSSEGSSAPSLYVHKGGLKPH